MREDKMTQQQIFELQTKIEQAVNFLNAMACTFQLTRGVEKRRENYSLHHFQFLPVF